MSSRETFRTEYLLADILVNFGKRSKKVGRKENYSKSLKNFENNFENPTEIYLQVFFFFFIFYYIFFFRFLYHTNILIKILKDYVKPLIYLKET